jgi:hypothetical protein
MGRRHTEPSPSSRWRIVDAGRLADVFNSTALIICCLIDGNSIFQVILCGTMWGLDRYCSSVPVGLHQWLKLCTPRFDRPPWSTGILIPASFLCGIASAIFIWRGGKKTKRVEKVEQFLKHALAMEEKQQTSNQGSPLFTPRPTPRPRPSPLGNTPITAGNADVRRNGKRAADSMVVESMIVPRHEDIP